jgi:hypothetical protein
MNFNNTFRAKALGLICFFLFGTLTLSGCGKNKAAEPGSPAPEQPTNGTDDVFGSDDTAPSAGRISQAQINSIKSQVKGELKEEFDRNLPSMLEKAVADLKKQFTERGADFGDPDQPPPKYKEIELPQGVPDLDELRNKASAEKEQEEGEAEGEEAKKPKNIFDELLAKTKEIPPASGGDDEGPPLGGPAPPSGGPAPPSGGAPDPTKSDSNKPVLPADKVKPADLLGEIAKGIKLKPVADNGVAPPAKVKPGGQTLADTLKEAMAKRKKQLGGGGDSDEDSTDKDKGDTKDSEWDD